MSWDLLANGAAVSSQWTTSGNNISYIAGNVGIGTTTPAGILDVEGGTAAAASNGTNLKLVAQAAGSGNQNGGNIIMLPGLATGTGTAGGVGVGTTTPTAIGGSGRMVWDMEDSTGNGLEFKMYSTTDHFRIYNNNGSAGFGNDSNNPIAFFVNGGANTKLYMLSTGVGIGTAVGNPVNALDVFGGGAVIGTSYAGTNTAPSNGLLVQGNVGIGTTSASTALQVAGVFTPAATNTYSLGNSSLLFTTVYATNATINTSDARLKKDVQSSDLGLEFINSLRPVSYHWREGQDSVLHYGLIAQETEKAIRSAKIQAGDRSSSEQVIVEHDKQIDRYGLRYTELISPLIKAIQELSSKFLGTQSDIERLKADNQALKEKAEKAEKDNATLRNIVDQQSKDLALIKQKLGLSPTQH